ncbi:MAG: winged helix-turn-helix domain-containing protein [Gammaproteobacteria bacterium]|nr:winged helix-turn-helix domain-containing protein [Gammaproteobacteria bacterium]
MDVLVYLSRRPGTVVSADEIIDSVWGGRPMGDNPVYKSVAKLRRALGDDANSPTYIATVAKKGYRLVADVVDETPAGRDTTRARSEVSLVRRFLPVVVGILLGITVAAALFWRPDAPPLELQSVSGFRGSHGQPSFAPDGRSIAFINTIDGAAHVWVLGSDQSAPRQLTSGEFNASRPRWSPDGLSILFTRQGSIWSIPVDGDEAEEIIRDGSNPNWSHDGKRIVFERHYEVWVASSDGGQQSRVTGVPRKELPLAPRWPAFSPDGTEIVFLDADSTPFADLWRISLAGGEPIQVTFDPRISSAPVWSPDGKSIIYSSQRAGSRTLWQVSIDSGTARPLLTGSGDDNFPDISSNGKKLVYSNRRERFAIVRSHLASGRHTVLHESRQLLIGPELSPDRNMIAFFGLTSDGAVQLFKMPVSGGSPLQLTFDTQATHAIPRWSADGKYLYFYYTKNGASFSRVESGGGEVETIIPGWDWSVTNGASVSPDNTQAVYSRLTGQAPVQTLVRQFSSGEDQSFYATLEYPRWSQDGLSILGARHTDQRFPGDIAICPVAGTRCSILARDARVPMWSADESQVYFVRGFGDSQELFVVPRNGDGAETKLMDMAPLMSLGPFYDVTSDGDVIWVRYKEEPSEIWLTELAGP